jgi:hypothetical protein
MLCVHNHVVPEEGPADGGDRPATGQDGTARRPAGWGYVQPGDAAGAPAGMLRTPDGVSDG